MIEKRPTLCIIAGPNGAGKTSTTIQLLHSEWADDSIEFRAFVEHKNHKIIYYIENNTVYIVENDSFPTSVVEVATAVPAFIGYTEKAMKGSVSLLNKPFRISSMAEFLTFSFQQEMQKS